MRSLDSVEPSHAPGRRQQKVTTVRKAIIFGALAALLVGAMSSLATARLTDRQSDVDVQLAENTRLSSQVSQLDAHIAALTSQMSQVEAQLAQSASQAGEGSAAVDRLNGEIATLKEQVGALQAAKAGLEAQLSQALNPAPGPTPTALLTAKWVHRFYPGDINAVVCVEIENTSDSDISISYAYSQFSALDGADFAYPPRLHTPGYGIHIATPLLNGQLGAGQKRRGALLFDVPAKYLLTRLVWNAGLGEAPEISVDLPAEVFLIVNNVIPGSDANNC